MYQLDMKVRDYECDIQGVVNNSVYLNYLEHSRHEFLMKNQVDFAGLAKQGIHLMVVRAELDYKDSLKPGDEFFVTVVLDKASRIKVVFDQSIFRKQDNKLMLSAKTYGVAVNKKGRPMKLGQLEDLVAEDAV